MLVGTVGLISLMRVHKGGGASLWGASSSRAAPSRKSTPPLLPQSCLVSSFRTGESARPVGLIKQLLADKLGAHHSTREVRQVLAKVKALAPTGRLGEARVISLEETDLIVDVSSTGEVSFWSREPDPERLIGARAQVPWRTGANRSALEEHLQRAVSSGEDRQVIQDYAGYSLLHWARPFRRALVLAGPEGSGAAPIMEVLSWPCARVSSVRPSRLARGRSGTLSPEAWANICHEADPEVLARLPLLSGPVLGDSPAEASSAESTSPEAASSSPRAAKYIRAKHIYSVGGLPPLAAGDPFFRRVLLVSCPETLGGRREGPYAPTGPLGGAGRNPPVGAGGPAARPAERPGWGELPLRPPGEGDAQALGASRRADWAL